MKKKYSLKERKEIEKNIKLSDFQKQPFSKQIDQYINNAQHNNENFYLGVTPKILINNGSTNHKLVMSQKVFEKITRTKSGHHIPVDTISNIYKFIESPLLLFKGNAENTLVEILEVKDDLDRELLISIRLDAKENFMDVSRITSCYGKVGLDNYISNPNHILIDWYNKKKTNLWLASRGRQLSKLSNKDSSYKYIICLKNKKSNK